MRGFTWTRMKSGSDTPVLITGVNASDSDNEDITYSLFEAPAGFSIDEVTGEITYDGPLSGLSDGLELAVVASDGKLEAVAPIFACV